MNRPWDECVTHVNDRAGHDHRYAIDVSKIKGDLGRKPKHWFESAIKTTIQ